LATADDRVCNFYNIINSKVCDEDVDSDSGTIKHAKKRVQQDLKEIAKLAEDPKYLNQMLKCRFRTLKLAKKN